MIQPNFDLMLWVILIGWAIKSICRIALGAANKDRATKYDAGDVIAGIISLIIVLVIAFA